ncbi:MAG: Peptide methionine sulfoxide reductase MsrA [candidate division CPR1 bacterium GW2011_GWC1_49_13]|uniref:Peptide methionine sulfoxide reductase MsrA n=1 Tax=candidate division CPR1 bacterium GW2011_GWC1_49_13 TaxID=1618342 RepID=A0A0G1VI37_9BACT|nr:MAG: Peptide methionine sulfoxide reductase MsrA [candidate division CPR1 bacterium GW2011_GWC1_49_13]
MAQIETATFAGGCFWCTEAVFRMIKGVEKVTSGYAGGERPSPTYEEVSSGQTGHKEAVQLAFDPQVVSYQELLDVFWKTHDPEQAGGQGADIGSQYQAAIFYHDENQKELAEKSKKGMEKEGTVTTEILPFQNFYPADEHHQKYFEKNPHAPYCRIVIAPKVEKVEKLFPEKLKK